MCGIRRGCTGNLSLGTRSTRQTGKPACFEVLPQNLPLVVSKVFPPINPQNLKKSQEKQRAQRNTTEWYLPNIRHRFVPVFASQPSLFFSINTLQIWPPTRPKPHVLECFNQRKQSHQTAQNASNPGSESRDRGRRRGRPTLPSVSGLGPPGVKAPKGPKNLDAKRPIIKCHFYRLRDCRSQFSALLEAAANGPQ